MKREEEGRRRKEEGGRKRRSNFSSKISMSQKSSCVALQILVEHSPLLSSASCPDQASIRISSN